MKMNTPFFIALMAIATTGFAQDCNDLFISEYVEGVGTNKALEIYNPTSSSIDLSEYMIIRYSNGATTALPNNAVQLSGTIAANDVYVAVLDKRDPNGTGQESPVWDSLQARADGFYCPVYDSSDALYFNGNDAVALAKGVISDILNSQVVDIFGKIGEDPGVAWTTEFPYTSGGVEITANHSLIRKPSVLKGQTNAFIAFFNALEEYDSIPALVEIGGQDYGNWFSLGEHSCDCASLSIDESTEEASLIRLFPNPSKGTIHLTGTFSEANVFNALGQKIGTITHKGWEPVSFDFGGKRGVFFVHIRDVHNKTFTKRVIVK